MKRITLSLVMITFALTALAQTPQAFKYQAVVRNFMGEIISNEAVGIRISIHDVTVGGTIVYQETFSETTNQFGLVNLEIGNGTATIGTFPGIDWSSNSKFLEIEIDPTGGNTYVSVGTSELLSVPYSLYSESTGDTTRWKKNNDDLYFNKGNVGIGTDNPGSWAKLHIKGNQLVDDGNSVISHTDATESFLNIYNTVSDWELVAASDNNRFDIRKWGGVPALSVLDNNFIGIGTTAPQAGLHVAGDNFPNSFVYIEAETGGDAGIRLYEGSTPEWHIYNNPTNGGLQIQNNAFQTVFFADQSTANVGIGTNTPNESALLDLNSNSKGMLIPRMTQTEIEAITNPANGLQAFNTDNGILYIYIWAENKWKEVQYGTGEIWLPASYTIGTGGTCVNNIVNGNYGEGVPLNSSNTITMDASVTTTGGWSITTNTLNGYSFSGSGVFETTATVQVTLIATGIPVTVQTDNFTATASNSGGACNFNVIVEAPPPCGSPFNDIRDNHNYNTVQIGTQCWMAENLNYEAYGWCYTNCSTYGRLFNWEEAKIVCPAGWHLPSKDEWLTMIYYVGPAFAGGELKEVGYMHWLFPNTGATNSYGFRGLPGGFGNQTDPFFHLLNYKGFWWTNEANSGSTNAWSNMMEYSSSSILGAYISKDYYLSVRCVREY